MCLCDALLCLAVTSHQSFDPGKPDCQLVNYFHSFAQNPSILVLFHFVSSGHLSSLPSSPYFGFWYTPPTSPQKGSPQKSVPSTPLWVQYGSIQHSLS